MSDREKLEAVEDYVTRHYLDTRMGVEILGVIGRTVSNDEPSDADLTKLANDAHHRMVADAEADGGWYGFSHSRDAWQDGFETGYRAARAAR